MPVLKAILNSALFQGVSTVLSPLPLQWDSPMCRLKTRADPAISILTLKQPQRHYTEEEDDDDDEDCFVFVSPSIRKVDRQRKLNQRETFWIDKLRATKHPGLNKDLDFPVFL